MWDREIHLSDSFSARSTSNEEQKGNRDYSSGTMRRTVYTRIPIYRQTRRGEFSSRTRSNGTKVAETEGKGAKRQAEKRGEQRGTFKEVGIKSRGTADRIIVPLASDSTCRAVCMRGNVCAIFPPCERYNHPVPIEGSKFIHFPYRTFRSLTMPSCIARNFVRKYRNEYKNPFSECWISIDRSPDKNGISQVKLPI